MFWQLCLTWSGVGGEVIFIFIFKQSNNDEKNWRWEELKLEGDHRKSCYFCWALLYQWIYIDLGSFNYNLISHPESDFLERVKSCWIRHWSNNIKICHTLFHYCSIVLSKADLMISPHIDCLCALSTASCSVPPLMPSCNAMSPRITGDTWWPAPSRIIIHHNEGRRNEQTAQEHLVLTYETD